ncbi:AMP-binding protein [Piscinibacter gummiphilus]|uniref:Long-chain-fatty-acid--CoA ligase n=1 Tax=Piscinibacter gummiphilus TaxID=946333 RepID=A0ABZ0CZ43_9BURK|nr:AMP-binding protein [Piscinibacter gummiphilus]WOB10219.1 AMP-binding protein [Piscinibacter gummiphilus]
MNDDAPWIEQYPPGVTATVDVNRYASVPALMEESFALHESACAYLGMGTKLSFGELGRLSRDLGAWLQTQGLQRGDRVALMMPNVLAYPVATAAVLRAGFVVVNVNPLYTPRELEHQLRDSGSCAIVILENFAATLQQVIDRVPVKLVVVATMGDLQPLWKRTLVNHVVRRDKKLVPPWKLPGFIPFSRALREGRQAALLPVDLGPSDLAVLQYTGGTTGVSKGAMLLHGTIIANLLTSEAWMQPGLKRRNITGQLTIVCALPLYHVFAFITCGLLGLRTGACNLLIANPRDLTKTIETLKPHRLHIFPGVNTLFNGLLQQPTFRTLYFSELVITNGGGTAVQEVVASRWLQATGCPIVEGYGLTETCSGVTCNPTDMVAFTGTVGLPLPNVAIRLIDEQGRSVPTGAAGEIAIKGPQVMAGYWQRPDETAQAMTHDGYLKTGDIGTMDERGFIRIVDRKKDMILVSGFNVFPTEIEGVVSSHPGVLECAAVGVPDEKTGEAVKLFVVRKDPALAERQLAAFCAEQLTAYKRPKVIVFKDELPKSNVGKILRRELRERA